MKRPAVAAFFKSLKCWPSHQVPSICQDVEKEQDTLEAKRKHGGWKCMPYIIGNETFEKVASYGLTANFMVYLVTQFNMEQMAAANFANVFSGTTNFAPLLGAYVSDAHWGRFRTLASASIASFLGMVVLTLIAMVPQLRPPSCTEIARQAGHCMGPSSSQLGVLLLSLLLLTLGSAGVRPCSVPFGVDQFDRTSEDGRRGLNSYFNWFYCTSTAATMLAMTAVVYIQDSISWALGFAIPTALMLLAILFFFLGTKHYIHVAPEGSVFSGVARVFVASFKKRSLKLPFPDDARRQETLLYNAPIEHARVVKLPLTVQFRFLNKAGIICEGDLKDGSPANPWRLCTIQQIEEVKCLIRIVPIWASSIICFVAIVQQWTFAVFQSVTMDRHLGPHFEIPPGSFGVVSLIAVTLFIPVYDRILVPMARRVTGIESGITLLQRQGIGMVISALSMVVAGLVEQKRRDSALAHGGVDGTSPMSALWLVPQLALMGVAEAFNAVGQMEFYNLEFPEHMQSLASAVFNCSLAGASYMSSILVVVIRENTGGHGRPSWLDNNINVGRVDYFYYLIAFMGMVNLFYFLACAHFYRYKGSSEVTKGSEQVVTTCSVCSEERLPLLVNPRKDC